MILRNYDNLLAHNALPWKSYTAYNGEKVFGDGYLACKDMSGTLIMPIQYNGYAPLSIFSENGSKGYSYLFCGSGDSATTYDDYKLASKFTTSQITNVSGIHQNSEPVYDEETNTISMSYTRNFLAKENITVKEIGVSHWLNNMDSTLVYRKVLETPLEVTAGNQFSLTFTSVVSLNPNKPANYEATASVE